MRNIVLGLLLTLPLDPTSLYGLKSFYRTKIDPLVAECEAKLQNRSVISPPLVKAQVCDFNKEKALYSATSPLL